MKRCITVCLEITDTEKVAELWDSHLNGLPILGCRVKCIAEGDVLSFKDKVFDHLAEKYEGVSETIDEMENEFYAPTREKLKEIAHDTL